MIYYLAPVDPADSWSGGTRKLGDHVAILNDHGIEAVCLVGNAYAEVDWHPEDLVVVPEVYGHALKTVAPPGIRRVSFVQNGYLIDMGAFEHFAHPYMDTPELVAIMTESDHSTALVRLRCPDLEIPVIRTHSSGVGRMGKVRDFRYGPWPRRPVVMYFDYKHEEQNAALLDGLGLPDGWRPQCLSGMTDEQIEHALRTGAIFVAPNAIEGMCAPTSEAMISGCLIVGWPGGPSKYAHEPTPAWSWGILDGAERPEMVGGPMEYLGDGRAWIVPQDDLEGLRAAVEGCAGIIDATAGATGSAEWSEWFQATYSREQEVAEICELMRQLSEAPARAELPIAKRKARPGPLRIGIGHETFGAASHQQRAATPAAGLRQLGCHVWMSSFTMHGDVITLPKVDDARVMALLEAHKQIPAVAPPPEIMVLRLMDQDEAESICHAREQGQLVFVDLDDDVWNMPEWNGARAYVKRDGEYLFDLPRDEKKPRSVDLGILERNIAAADAVLCSTPGVARAVAEHVQGARTYICRNGIDPTGYYWPRKPVEHPQLRVAWMGVTSAQNHGGLLDILPSLAHVLSEYGCEFWHLGAGALPFEPPITRWLPPEWSVKVVQVPWAAAKHLPWLLSEIDVGIIARRPHRFTEAQSAVSGLSYGAAGVPFVASRTEEYAELEKNGCGRTFEHPDISQVLVPILESKELRAELRQSGRDHVYWNHGPQHVARQYLEAFEAFGIESHATTGD